MCASHILSDLECHSEGTVFISTSEIPKDNSCPPIKLTMINMQKLIDERIDNEIDEIMEARFDRLMHDENTKFEN